MSDKPDYVEEAERQLRERWPESLNRIRSDVERDRHELAEMSPMERVTRKKHRHDIDAYKRGVRAGWEQAAWGFAAVCLIVYVVLTFVRG